MTSCTYMQGDDVMPLAAVTARHFVRHEAASLCGYGLTFIGAGAEQKRAYLRASSTGCMTGRPSCWSAWET